MPEWLEVPVIGSKPVRPAPATLTPEMQIFQNSLMLAAAGVIVTQWEKLAAWVVAGFAAALALIMSNYAQAVEMTSPGAVKAVLRMFVAVAVFHVVQRLLGTLVQAGVAAAAESAKVKPPAFSPEQGRLMLDDIANAMWWPMRLLVRASYRRMLNGDIAHMGKYTMYMAQGSMVAALLQVLLGVWAVVRVWSALHV